MKNRIRNKYIIRNTLLLFITIGSMILFYNIFADDYYIGKSKEQIVENYKEVCSMDLSKLNRKNKKCLDEIVEQGFNISIIKGKKMVYSSLNTMKSKKKIKRLSEKVYDKYTEKPNVEVKDRQIVIRGKKNQNGEEYLIHIDIKIKTLESSIDVFSSFLLWEMVFVLLAGVILAIQLGNSISKPIVKLSKMTKKMAKNEYTGYDDFAFQNDEIGDLAAHIENMYNEISGHINELNNYNYLLKNQNKDLVEFDRRRKEFISKATHELKTPLAIISSQMEMVNLEHPDVVKEYYESISEEIEKMSKLIRDMLNSSFYETVDVEKDMEIEDLSKLVKSMEQKYNVWLGSKNIYLYMDVQDGIRIKMIREQIEQALNNYVINAYEHTRKNGVVRITLKKRDNIAVLSVFNEGKNIEEDKIEYIWDYYNQADKVTNANVGLGLFIVKDIVKSHEGKYYLENKPKGVAFTMEFEIIG